MMMWNSLVTSRNMKQLRTYTNEMKFMAGQDSWFWWYDRDATDWNWDDTKKELIFEGGKCMYSFLDLTLITRKE